MADSPRRPPLAPACSGVQCALANGGAIPPANTPAASRGRDTARGGAAAGRPAGESGSRRR